MFGINLRTKLSNAGKKLLRKNGYAAPQKSNAYSDNTYNIGNKNISVCTFYNNDGLPIKRIKTIEDITTNKKETQARFYHYLGEKGANRKLKEINQYKFNSDNECVGATDWRFYHPKRGEIRFSMKSGNERKNNFLQADGVRVDSNGFAFRPISIAEYLDIKRDMGRKHFVSDPWTLNESITSEYGATDSIQECAVVGIVGDKGISLNHLNPNNIKNKNTRRIENCLAEQLEQQGKNAKAFLIGACDDDRASKLQFDMLDDFFAVRKIPHTKYKTGDKVLYTDFDLLSKIKTNDAKRIKYGDVTPFYYSSGQHVVYRDGEVKLTNLVIDSELEQGNINPDDLIRKSFQRIY